MVRHIAHLLVLAFLLSAFPAARLVAAPSALATSDTLEPPPPTVLTVPPVTDPHLPSLSLDLVVAPDPLPIGDTATISLTLSNSASDPAQDLVVSLPTPDGAFALAGPVTINPMAGWQWNVGTLAARSSTTLTATLRLLRMPAGQALLLHPQATARGLPLPIHNDGGALLIDRTFGAASASFSPGTPALLRSADGRVSVQLPPSAAAQALTLRHASTPLASATLPPPFPNFQRGLGTFFLDASDAQGNAVHQFAAPLTLSVRYTPEQLLALGIAEADLTLFWFNPTTQHWEPIPSSVDPAGQTVSATITHFSAFQLGDGASPSAEFLPSLQGFQASSFTGAASYTYPFALPAGPGGLKPSLSLSYSSAALDGSSGQRLKQQAGWVGQGWSLDSGSVAANKMPNGQLYYALALNGQSYDLLRGAALPGVVNPSVSHPTDWDWRATDESFLRVRVLANGVSTSTRGGFSFGSPYPRYIWQLWTKDGTRYDFEDDLWWGWEYCNGGSGDYAYLEAYKWQLTTVTDPHGNTIHYTYGRDSLSRGETCFHVQGTIDRDIWPSAISWGGNSVTGASDRYQLTFQTSARASDTQFDGADNQYGGTNGQPRQTRRLDALQLWSNPSTSWQLIGQYNLSYDYSLTTDTMSCPSTCSANTTYPKLTLRSIVRVGSDGTSALPPTSFSYGAFGYSTLSGTNYPAGGTNRLTQVDNGQGGVLSLSYETIGAVRNSSLFVNNRRIISKTVSDGRGHSYSWSYRYGTPAFNSLGTTRGPQSSWGSRNYGTQSYPNSAALYYNAFSDVLHDNEGWLAHKLLKEFRGHDWVLETDPRGAQTQHFYYQGQASDQCIPTVGGANLTSDACFQRLRDGEFLKGKEYATKVFAAGADVTTALPLRESDHSYSVVFYDYNDTPQAGLWRAFSYESRSDEKQNEGTSTPVGHTTNYVYDVSYNTNSNGGVYGNLSRVNTYATLDTSVAPLRYTTYYYAIRDDATAPPNGSPYIVDRSWAEYTWYGAWQSLAYTARFYDGASTQGTIGTAGDLTRTSAFFDLPASVSSGKTVHSQDTTYGYDGYGNRTTETTYAGAGTATFNGSNWSFSAPGGDSATRTTTTTYDALFHALPLQQTNPLGHVTKADYDERMGTLIRVTGPNTTGATTDCSQASYTIPATEETTCAQYDVFGRLLKLVKPGDSSTYPTLRAAYYDSEQLLRYSLARREQANTGNVRWEQQFYDGLGRKIQLKQEGPLGWQNIVVDTQYDGLNQITAQSQPRYSSETATSFWQYTTPGVSLFNATSTSYDEQGRPLRITTPDGKWSEHHYGLIGTQTYDDLVDANRHRTQARRDGLGRLVQLDEIIGDCGNYWPLYSCTAPYSSAWVVAASTQYAYSALDQLTRVTDAGGNVTSMSYDSLGRKRTMNDPDMGGWSYSYDSNGNLLTQTDAQGQTIWFGYDALSRLTAKRVGSASGTLLASYGYDAGTNGVGQRTSMSVPGGASSNWTYDARGRKISATDSVPGLAGTRTFGWAYDSADRLTQVTYPSLGGVSEHLTYSYDAAWRPSSLCSDRTGQPCYVSGASYTALDQPDGWSLGNSLSQNWSYSSPMQRLSQLQVGGGTPAAVFDRSYSYDNVGNVAAIVNNQSGVTQAFTYDARDRLTRWSEGASSQSYSYDLIGNLTSKSGVGSYSYGAQSASCPTGALDKAHAVVSAGTASYCYDRNGNLLNGGTRSYTWDRENRIASVSSAGVQKSYTYDLDPTAI